MDIIESEAPTEHELLQSGMEKLDDALSYLMEMKSPEGKAIAHFVFAAIRYAERIDCEYSDSECKDEDDSE